MIAELIGAAQSVQALGSLLKSASSLANYNEIVLAVSEVNTKLMQANAVALTAQERQATQAAQIHDLEVELQAIRAWNKEAEGLERVQVASGVFAYMYKVRSGTLEQEPKFCSNCYLQQQPSLLQQSNEPSLSIGLHCMRCKGKVVFRHYGNAA